MQQNNVSIPLNLKLTMTVKEAAEYSNIGINRIDRMLRNPNCPFVLYVGTKKLVKRKEFEQFISNKLTIFTCSTGAPPLFNFHCTNYNILILYVLY